MFWGFFHLPALVLLLSHKARGKTTRAHLLVTSCQLTGVGESLDRERREKVHYWIRRQNMLVDIVLVVSLIKATLYKYLTRWKVFEVQSGHQLRFHIVIFFT